MIDCPKIFYGRRQRDCVFSGRDSTLRLLERDKIFLRGFEMSDELKKRLRRELDEIRRNKIRIVALGVCVVIAAIMWLINNSSRGEEIALNEPTPAPATSDLPVKPLPAVKSVDGVTTVLGADASPLIVVDPFAGAQKPKPAPKIAAPNLPTIPNPQPQPTPKPQESIALTGTALSGSSKVAMFLRGKETLFLTIGDELGGRKISDITADAVIFADGSIIIIEH